MEVAILLTLVGAIQELSAIADKVQENRQQCKRLCLDLDRLMKLLENLCSNGVPPKVAPKVIKLAR